jgi:excisionase family DNA binding protein
MERKAFNLRETAEALGVSLHTIRRLVKTKKLKTIRLSTKGHHLVPVKEIDRILIEGNQ